MEEEAFSIRARGVASAPAGVPARAAAEGGSPRRAGRFGYGHLLADVGSAAAVGAAGTQLCPRGSEHRSPLASARGPWHAGMSGWRFSSTTAHARLAFSPSALADASGRPAMAVPATSKPSFRATWSAWTASTSASSRASARSGRSRPGRACSFAFAQVIPSVEAIHCARFLKRVLLPAYRKAGWKLKRVLTDHGSEFKGLFDAVCSELGIHHTRTKPRSSRGPVASHVTSQASEGARGPEGIPQGTKDSDGLPPRPYSAPEHRCYPLDDGSRLSRVTSR